MKREWTEGGFYVDFEVSKELPLIDLIDFEGHWPIDGPEIRSADIHRGGGSILWGENGYADCIEMYAFGNFFNEQVKDFELLP